MRDVSKEGFLSALIVIEDSFFRLRPIEPGSPCHILDARPRARAGGAGLGGEGGAGLGGGSESGRSVGGERRRRRRVRAGRRRRGRPQRKRQAAAEKAGRGY